MKNSKIRPLAAEGEKTIDNIILELEQAIKADEPISKKDKKGGKASDAEIANGEFIKTNIAKFEQELPRNFSEDDFFEGVAAIKSKLSQVDDLKGLINNLLGQVTVLRIELKPDFHDIKTAIDKAATKDNTLVAIKNRINEPYAKNITKSTEDSEVKTNESPK